MVHTDSHLNHNLPIAATGLYSICVTKICFLEEFLWKYNFFGYVCLFATDFQWVLAFCNEWKVKNGA